jgi:hypothetical protein
MSFKQSLSGIFTKVLNAIKFSPRPLLASAMHVNLSV